jgi:SpoVK/Ycf46/Vps4 family AAA+-type ATPase
MEFTGNPGTGKTTVARIIGKIFKQLGFLSSGHFIEVTRENLVGPYIGQTAPKVMKAVKDAKGGIMFIDEAYSLYQNDDNDFGNEAVSTLVKEMEDFKDDLVIIFAGYPKEMDKMINMNPGLRDRIAFKIEFPDYTFDELISIFKKMCDDNNYTYTDDAIKLVEGLINLLYKNKGDNFGNGRIIRKIFERIEIIQNNRICKINEFSKDKINLITDSDIKSLYEDKEIKKIIDSFKNKKTLGFSI